MQISPDRVRKGELKMYGLMLEIRDVWRACGEVRGRPVPGGQLDLDELDDVVIALDHALVSIRTLDLEVFQESDHKAYLALRDASGSPQGLTVRALTAPRNNAVHHADVIDPDIAGALGPMPETKDHYLINPRWKHRSGLPTRMFEDAKGRKQVNVAAAYDNACAGLPILDTLLDAFAFFDAIDPRLARRNPDGSLTGFPLTPYPIANRYRRLDPSWPTEAAWNVNRRHEAQRTVPVGPRSILGVLHMTDNVVLCGYTTRTGAAATVYTESAAQVLRDIEKGAAYTFDPTSGATGSAMAAGGEIAQTDGTIVSTASLTDLTGRTKPWAGWWAFCCDDAAYYARQRE